MRSYFDIAYASPDACRLDVHLPTESSFPVFVYFHGGGLERGDKGRHSEVFKHLTARGIAVVSVNYRMYPTAAYPDFIEDAAAAVDWTCRHMDDYGEVRGIYVGGSSAGGYLSMMLCFDRRWLAPYGIVPTDLAGFVHDAGQPTCHFKTLASRGIDSRRVIVDESAALYHVGEDNEYPPMLFIVSDQDMECRYEQTMLMLATLKHFGHSERVQLQLMHGTHCAYRATTDEAGNNLLGQLVEGFIKEFSV